MIRPSLAALALALITATAAAAQQERTAASVVVRGFIVDRATVQPLAGALVEFPAFDRRAITDTNGRFTVVDLPGGSHTVTVRMLGYEDYEGNFRVGVEETNLTIALGPRPIVLEGITASGFRYADLIERRRERAGVSAQVLDRDRLSMASEPNALGALLEGFRLQRVVCASAFTGGNAVAANADLESDMCVMVRGRSVQPAVFIDEQPAVGGLRDLDVYQTSDLFAMEVFRGGSHIRVYTTMWIEMEGRRNGRPIPFLPGRLGAW